MHVMIDLETLGTRPDGAILQIGAVLFEAKSGGRLLNGKGFNEYVLLQDGNGTIDHDTVRFWLGEKSAPRMSAGMQRAMNLNATLKDVLQRFNRWPHDTCDIGWEGIEGVWALPSNFDLSVLKSAYHRLGLEPPWHRSRTRCAKTLFELVGYPDIDWTGLTHHDAMDDAIGQAMGVQKAMEAFKQQ